MSSDNLQQTQPLVRDKVRDSSLSINLESISSSPKSLTRTAMGELASTRNLLIRVVFPEPKYPAITVTGIIVTLD